MTAAGTVTGLPGGVVEPRGADAVVCRKGLRAQRDVGVTLGHLDGSSEFCSAHFPLPGGFGAGGSEVVWLVPGLRC